MQPLLGPLSFPPQPHTVFTSQKFVVLTSYNMKSQVTYWKRGLLYISWWSCGVLHNIVDECSDVTEERVAGGNTFLQNVGTLIYYTEQKPKRRLSIDRRLQNFSFSCFGFWKSLTIHMYMLSCYTPWFLQVYLHKNMKIAWKGWVAICQL